MFTPSNKPQPSGPTSSSDPAPRPSRRTFTSEYKLAILAEYQSAATGEKGAILRREGLYSSHLIEWTRARDAGRLTTPAGKPSTRQPTRSVEQIEVEKLRRRNDQLESELKKTRMALDIMGKAHALLEELSESAGHERPSRTS